PEAVEAVVDLVTLIKSGLNDPNKPFAVFLFIGPTGVGKTELARAVAEHLFGDVNRLVRLDMSEYATYEAYERLIGNVARNEAGDDSARAQSLVSSGVPQSARPHRHFSAARHGDGGTHRPARDHPRFGASRDHAAAPGGRCRSWRVAAVVA